MPGEAMFEKDKETFYASTSRKNIKTKQHPLKTETTMNRKARNVFVVIPE